MNDRCECGDVVREAAEARKEAAAQRAKVQPRSALRNYIALATSVFAIVLLVFTASGWVIARAHDVGNLRYFLPSAPSIFFTRKYLLIWLALPAAALCSLVTAILVWRYKRLIRSRDDIWNTAGYQPLAIFPPRTKVMSSVYEAYELRLAAGVESAFRRSGARSFLLIAPQPRSDDPTFISSLRDRLGGLGLKTIIVPESQLTFSVLQAGVASGPDSASSASFVTQAINELKTRYDLVLIEAAMLLGSVQTEYLSRYTDSTLLFIECGITVRRDLHASVLLLEQVGAAEIQIVAKEVPTSSFSAGELVSARQSPLSSLAHETSNRTEMVEREDNVTDQDDASGETPELEVATVAEISPVLQPKPPMTMIPTLEFEIGASELLQGALVGVSVKNRVTDAPDASLFLPLEEDRSEPTVLSTQAVRKLDASHELTEDHLDVRQNSTRRWDRIPPLRPLENEWSAEDAPLSRSELEAGVIQIPEASLPQQSLERASESLAEASTRVASAEESKKGDLSRRWGLLSRYRKAQDQQD